MLESWDLAQKSWEVCPNIFVIVWPSTMSDHTLSYIKVFSRTIGLHRQFCVDTWCEIPNQKLCQGHVLYTRLCHISTFLLIIINHENAIQLGSEAYVAGYISSHCLVLELALDTFILRAVELVVRSVFLLKSKGHRYSSCHPSSRWSGILPKCCQRQSVVTPRYEISFWAHHRTIWTLYVLIIQESGRQCRLVWWGW